MLQVFWGGNKQTTFFFSGKNCSQRMPVWIVKACCQFDCSMKSLYLVSELDKRMEDVESKESEDEISNASIEPTVTEDVVDEDCSQETTKRS